MSALEVEFVEFDGERRPRGENDPILTQFAAALVSSPGRWAKYPKPLSPKSVSSMAAKINRTRSHPVAPVPFDDGTFQARTRSGVLYVRCTPGDPS